MAAQGLREGEDGEEKIANPEELAMVRRQGKLVAVSAFSTALLATGLLLLVP
jgi:hypothetical protein